MKKASRSRTPSQDRIAARAAKVERLKVAANDPRTPRLIGMIASVEAWRQRPLAWEQRLAEKSDARIARSEADLEASKRRSDARLQEALGRYHRIKTGQPEIVPASPEVMQAQFIDEQTVPKPPQQPDQPE